MKIGLTEFTLIIITLLTASSDESSLPKTIISILKVVASNDIAKEWSKKNGGNFEKCVFAAEKIASENKEFLKNNTIQLNNIELSKSIAEIKEAVKSEGLVGQLNELRASKHHFEAIVSSYTSNSKLLAHQLEQFILDYRQKGSSTKLVKILDSDAVIDEVIKSGQDNHGPYGSSTMKTVYEIYITSLMAIVRGDVIIEIALNIRSEIIGDQYEEGRRYNQFRENEIFTAFFASLQRSFNKLKDSDVAGYIDFSVNGNKNPVRMINVLQFFWENEKYLSSAGSCISTCSDYHNNYHNGNGCFGKVRDCKFAVSLEKHARIEYQSPQVDRIYMGYTYENQERWYGLGGNEQSSMKSYAGWFFTNCHVCKCICDQQKNAKTIRKIYTGKIEAPDGYVVTGVRFVKFNRAIYPQIQAGKLLPLLTVDQESVKWIELPIDDDYETFAYDKRKILFGDGLLMKFADKVVTGVQFEKYSGGVKWSFYGRVLLDFHKGSMGTEYRRFQKMDKQYSCLTLDATNKIPGLSTCKNFKILKHYVVRFGISNEEADAGQSFVPYFDGTEVSFDIKAPLSGIGLIHYTNNEKYAGYIRPLISSLDYRKIFNSTYKSN